MTGRQWAVGSGQCGRRAHLLHRPLPTAYSLKKAGRPQMLGPAACCVAGGGSHDPAGGAGSALTGPLVIAPKKQIVTPEANLLGFPLEAKREAGRTLRRAQSHATPLAEALHVPLHVEASCWRAAQHCRRAPPWPKTAGKRSGNVGLQSSGFGMGADARCGNVRRKSCPGGPTHVRLVHPEVCRAGRHTSPTWHANQTACRVPRAGLPSSCRQCGGSAAQA
jgi:hypothetical protein